MQELNEIFYRLDFSSLLWQILTPLLFTLGDFVSGYIQAVINKNVDSQKMRNGLLHKSLIILVITLSFLFEFTFNLKYVSKFICIYVILMEISSILENLKKAGINIGKIGNILKEKSDMNENVNNLINKVDKIVEKGGNEKDEKK